MDLPPTIDTALVVPVVGTLCTVIVALCGALVWVVKWARAAERAVGERDDKLIPLLERSLEVITENTTLMRFRSEDRRQP